ncbi:hypothetical protein D3C86_1483410 [compost metagenome]
MTTSSAGTATISAYHSLATSLFSRRISMLRWPPLESETGMLILKSGLMPTGLSSSPLYMAIELIDGSYLVLAMLLVVMPRPGEPRATVPPDGRVRLARPASTVAPAGVRPVRPISAPGGVLAGS